MDWELLYELLMCYLTLNPKKNTNLFLEHSLILSFLSSPLMGMQKDGDCQDYTTPDNLDFDLG